VPILSYKVVARGGAPSREYYVYSNYKQLRALKDKETCSVFFFFFLLLFMFFFFAVEDTSPDTFSHHPSTPSKSDSPVTEV